MKALEMRIMTDIIRRIKDTGEITSAADWQINRLTQLTGGMNEVNRAIAEALDFTEEDVQALYSGILETGHARDAALYKAAGALQIPLKDNEPLQQLLSSVSAQTNETLRNITQSLGFAQRGTDGHLSFTPIADYYQKTLDSAALDIASGAFDYNTVLKRTVREMTNSGLRTVHYASGWSNRVDVAARRAVMTGMNQLTAKVSEDNAEKLGTDWVEISWHSGARPSHWWGGKWFTRQQLVTVCGLGTVTGLCGANCYHHYDPVIPGLSEPNYTDEELAALNEQEKKKTAWRGQKFNRYEATQKQRRMETTMRTQREEIALLEKGGAAPEDIAAARARYNITQHEYVDFSKTMGIPQQFDRVMIDGRGTIGNGTIGDPDRPSPVKIPPVGAKRGTPVTPEERREMLSRGPVDVHKPSIDNSGESGIISGRGSGSGNSTNTEHTFEKIGEIDFSDKKAIAKSLQEFEQKYANSRIEHCRVFCTNGEVYEVHGDLDNVDTDLLGDRMKGSINEHNHVIGEGKYTFSWEDLKNSVQDGSYISMAFDEKYRYSMTFPNAGISEDDAYEAFQRAKFSVGDDMILHPERIPIGDEQHERIKRACKELGIKYSRVPR